MMHSAPAFTCGESLGARAKYRKNPEKSAMLCVLKRNYDEL